MTRNYLFSQNESKAIESKWSDCPLYKVLKTATLEWRKHSKLFYLRPDEVFYHVLRSIDELKVHSDKLSVCENLWNELYDYICNRINADEKEIKNAVSLIVGSVDNSLYCLSELLYWDEIMELRLQNARNNKTSGLLLDALFVNLRKNTIVKEWLKDYMVSDLIISNQIGDDIRRLRNEPTFNESPIELTPEGIPQSVINVFAQPHFVEDYVKQMISNYYEKPLSLACIFRVLSDYGFLKVTDNYLDFVTALVDWNLIVLERSKIHNLADQVGAYMRIKKVGGKYRPALKPGFREWEEELSKYKDKCVLIASVFHDEDDFLNPDGKIHYIYKVRTYNV